MVSIFKYLAIILVLAGVFVYLFGHFLVFAAFIIALGVMSLLVNIIGVVLESSGDVSFL